MKLPFFLKNNRGNSKNYLALFLKEEEAIAFVLCEEGGKMIIREKEKFHYSNGWEHIKEDIDEVLFRFEQKLNISLDQTIFFIYSHFIDEKTGDIRMPYIQKIKEIVKNLELKALGYIECSEAVLHFLEKKEEMPLTAILVELDKTNVGVFVYKGGKISYRKVISRTDNLIDDLLTAFGDLKGKFLLPARIILYNSKDLDDESTKILTYQWSEDYFIQLPRVEVLNEDDTVEGLMNVFQEQLMKEKGSDEIQPQEKKEVLGFVIGGDVQEEVVEEKKISTKNPFFLGINFKEFIKRIKLPKIKFPQFNISKRISIVFGIIFIVLSLLLNEFFFHSATLTIYFPSDPVSKELVINTSVNETNSESLPVLVSTSSASFTDSKQTTGKRDIGDHAKGAVTLYNFEDNEKVFQKGALLVTNGFKFVLDNDVKVASSSLSTDGSAKLPGKSNGTVTASDIGAESNIEKGARFKIGDLSQTIYFAINDNALSGGTRKQVQTVSTKDLTDLKISIINKAKNPGNENIKSDLLKDEEIIPQLSTIEMRDLTYSKEVGEEASSVTLQGTADTIYFYLKKDMLLKYLMGKLLPDVKNGFTLEKGRIHYTIDSANKKDDTVTLNLSTNSKAIKQVSKDEIVNNILGKNRSSVESVLKKQFQAEGFDLSIKEPLPFLNTMLPLLKNNIRVVISSL